MSELRQQGYPSPDQVSDAILEKNGKLTILPKAEFSPPTLGDLQIQGQSAPLMHVVLTNGICNEAGLRLIGKDRDWLLHALRRSGYAPADLFCVTANQSGQIIAIPLQKKKKGERPS